MIPQYLNQTCVTASADCTTLKPTDLTKCSVCDQFYALNGGTELCMNCQNGTIPDCEACAYNSSVTGHEFTCTSCLNDKILFRDGQMCIVEIDDCATYNFDDPTKCDLCADGFGYVDGQSRCEECSVLMGYGEAGDPAICLTCSNTPSPYTTTCDDCVYYYELVDADGTC